MQSLKFSHWTTVCIRKRSGNDRIIFKITDITDPKSAGLPGWPGWSILDDFRLTFARFLCLFYQTTALSFRRRSSDCVWLRLDSREWQAAAMPTMRKQVKSDFREMLSNKIILSDLNWIIFYQQIVYQMFKFKNHCRFYNHTMLQSGGPRVINKLEPGMRTAESSRFLEDRFGLLEPDDPVRHLKFRFWMQIHRIWP